MIRVRQPSGKQQLLATSLLDSQRYPARDFAELYHPRWGIEEAFKLLKHRLMIEQCSGESPGVIRQNVHAKTFTANLVKAMTYALARLRYRLFGWLLQKIEPDQVLALLGLIVKIQECQRAGRLSQQHKTQPKPRLQYK